MLLIDIGSTYTKLAVADPDKACIVATASAPTTVHDVGIGFSNGLAKLVDQGVPESLLAERYASSSAAGGLRMVAVGLVPELTLEASRRAAFGAGAKVVGSFAFKLTRSKLQSLIALAPDIILLSGGTDGGEQATIVHNAEMIAASELDVPVVLAGNAEAVDEIKDLFAASGKDLYITENVMPSINKLNIEPVREVIRNIFINRIILAKGLDKINSYINGVAMPTPLAVLEAARTMGELVENGVLLLDIGGATTDVHSISYGYPSRPTVVLKGLPEPYAKRTVEGDLGMRHNIRTIVDQVGKEKFFSWFPPDQSQLVEETMDAWAVKPDTIAKTPLEQSIDLHLAASAVEMAVDRHCGRIEEMWTPDGKVVIQYGKDLTNVDLLLGTGGPLVNSPCPEKVLQGAKYDSAAPNLLKPRSPRILIDKQYILFSIGLIRQRDPKLALSIAEKYLKTLEE